MYDASVKEPSGIEYGDVYQFGSFDECLSAFYHHPKNAADYDVVLAGDHKTDNHRQRFAGRPTFSPQYCLADVMIQGFAISTLSSRKHETKVSTMSAN